MNFAAMGLCLLVGVDLASCGVDADDEPVMVPGSVPVAPGPGEAYVPMAEWPVPVDAPALNGIDGQWVIRGIRLWDDNGEPCGEPLKVGDCLAAEIHDGQLKCRDARNSMRLHLSQDPETGEFEIHGHGSAVVYAGVQTSRAAGELRADFGRAALVAIAGRESRHVVLRCEPRGDVQVRVLEAGGRQSVDIANFPETWEFYVWDGKRSEWGRGEPRTAKGVRAGWPVWVRVFKNGMAGMWKQVIVERNRLNTVEFRREPGPRTVLTGRVVAEATGAPVSDAVVIATLEGEPKGVWPDVRTDRNGRYVLELAPGIWRISASAGANRRARHPGAVLAPGTWTLDLAVK